MGKLISSLLYIFFSLIPTYAFGIGYPSFHSEIPGVSIWVPHKNKNDLYPNEGAEDRDYEFIPYCNGKNTVYIHELNKRVPCKAVETNRGANWSNFRIEILDNSYHPKGGITVSKKSLSKGSYSIDKPSSSDLSSISEIVAAKKSALASVSKKNLRDIFPSNDSLKFRAEYNRAAKEVANSSLYKEAMEKELLLQAEKTKYLIIPIGAELQPLGWNLRSAIFTNRNGNIEFIGEITGCINNLLDVNSDGVPEIGTWLCENNEGSHSSYWSIFPAVKEVISRSQ